MDAVVTKPPYTLLGRFYDELTKDAPAMNRHARRKILGRILRRVRSACDLGCGSGATAMAFLMGFLGGYVGPALFVPFLMRASSREPLAEGTAPWGVGTGPGTITWPRSAWVGFPSRLRSP